jgi:hypothetical protein
MEISHRKSKFETRALLDIRYLDASSEIEEERPGTGCNATTLYSIDIHETNEKLEGIPRLSNLEFVRYTLP